MSERYSRLFSLPKNLYVEGAPVLIAAGALLKDNQSNKVLVQLKLKNIGNKLISAVTVSIQPFDMTGKPLGEVVTYSYLDLNADRDIEFGTKEPIFLPDDTTRSFRVSVTSTVFADKSTWNSDDDSWEDLPIPATLDDFLKDSELVKQYQLKYGEGCRVQPQNYKNLWICACGALNQKSEKVCHLCQNNLEEMQNVDLDQLKTERDIRLAEEEKEALLRAEKTKKLLKIFFSAVVALTALALLLSFGIKRYQESAALKKAYNSAFVLLEEESFEEAIEAFDKLGDYKDSKAQAKKAQDLAKKAATEAKKLANYSDAMDLMGQKKYEEALVQFESLGSYKDSKEKVLECGYLDAVQLITKEAGNQYAADQTKAYNWFSNHKDYKDSATYLGNFVERVICQKSDSGSKTRFIYDSTGLVSAYDMDYASGGTYRTKVQQTKFGNWYVVVRTSESGTVNSYLYYQSPYEPFPNSHAYLHGTFNDSKAEYKDNILTLSWWDDGIITSATCYENGSVSYRETRDGQYDDLDMTYTINVTLDGNGRIVSFTNTGRGTANDGNFCHTDETRTYQYDNHGNYTSENWSTKENWGGEKESKRGESYYTCEYDPTGKVISIIYNGGSFSTYEYANVYCPDAAK